MTTCYDIAATTPRRSTPTTASRFDRSLTGTLAVVVLASLAFTGLVTAGADQPIVAGADAVNGSVTALADLLRHAGDAT